MYTALVKARALPAVYRATWVSIARALSRICARVYYIPEGSVLDMMCSELCMHVAMSFPTQPVRSLPEMVHIL